MPTPKESILQHCRECVSGDMRHVKECQGDTIACPLWPVRIKEGKISVRHIRNYCLYCMGGTRELVLNCQTYTCTLHPYRLGKSPNAKKRKVSQNTLDALAKFRENGR